MRSKTIRTLIPLSTLLLVGVLPPRAGAQTTEPGGYDEQICEFYKFGVDTIEVYAWGAVAKPCMWQVDKDIQFVDFVTVVQARGLDVAETFDTSPQVDIQIYRTTQSGRAKVFEASLEDILSSLAPTPVLENGDLVVFKPQVKRKRRIVTFRNFTAVLGTASTVVLLYLRLSQGN